jgi:drug/metabolite transporter (DMT)-like permease
MNKYKGELALLGVAFIWGTGFVATATALEQFSPFQILAIRFILGTLIIGTVFFKKLRGIDMTTLKYGTILGALLVSGFALVTIGLMYTTPAKNAFIVATNVIIVPFIGTLIYRRKVDGYNITGAFTAMAGIGLMSLTASGGFINTGDILTLTSAILFAFHIFYTSEFMARGMDTARIVVVQFATCAVLAAAAALVTGQTDFTRAGGQGLAVLLYLGLFNTSLCFFMQTWAQRFTSETKVAIIISMECVFGAMLSVALGFEPLTVRMFFGAVLILSGVLIAEVRPSFRRKPEPPH